MKKDYNREVLEQAAMDLIEHDMTIILEFSPDEIQEYMETASNDDLIEFISSYE